MIDYRIMLHVLSDMPVHMCWFGLLAMVVLTCCEESQHGYSIATSPVQPLCLTAKRF